MIESVPDFCTIDNDCPHADQHLVVDRASMQDCPMTDRYIIAYQ